MKKSIRLLGVLFAILSILCCAQFAFAADYTITTGTPISVTSKGYEEVYVKFVPEVSGTYKFVADSGSSFCVYGSVYGDSDDNHHLEIVDSFEAGTEYEFEICLNNIWTKYDKIDVVITLDCTHEKKTVIPANAFTCTEDGYSEKIVCADCDWVIKDSEVRIARHIDTDNDYVCDICTKEALLLAGTYEDIGYDEDDNEITYTIEYKFYANGDLYIDGEGEFSLYNADELDALYDSLYDYETKEHTPNFRNVYVGKGISYIFINGGEKYIIDPENKDYSSDAYGVLFSKDGKTLIEAPSDWKETSYNIPAGVENIEAYAFEYAKKLKTVTIPDSVTYIGSGVFDTDILACDETVDGLIYIGDILVDDIGGYNDGEETTIDIAKVRESTRIIADGVAWYDGVVYEIPASVEIICDGLYYDASAYNIHPDNKIYSSIDGVLFSKDKTVLVQYPGMAERSSYTVPAGVKTIGEEAFETVYLREIILPEGLEIIGVGAIYAPGVANIVLPKTLKRIENFGIMINDNGRTYYEFGIIVPESVEYLGRYSVGEKVAILNPDCYIDPDQYFTFIAGYKGSTAEEYKPAEDEYCEFYSLSGIFHKHVDFGAVTKAPTCTEDGEVKFACPCGKNKAKTEKLEASHVFYRVIVEGMVECEICEQEFDGSVIFPSGDCDCICHNYYYNPLKTFIYNFKVFFWRLFRTNRICECGKVFHY